MPETKTPTELTSQYTAQVVADLERNAKEQERVGAEMEALQEQLTALRHDHAVLTNLQQALGTTGAPAATTPEPAATSVPRQKTSAKSAEGKAPEGTSATGKSVVAKAVGGRTVGGKAAGGRRSRAKKADSGRTTAAGASAARKPGSNDGSAQPTLIDLIRRYLTEQREPRSAAEVSTALGATHPERRIQTNVVRTTLENLVAKSHAHRAKQGTSVFYTAVDAVEPSVPSPVAQQPVKGEAKVKAKAEAKSADA
ncbi:hypothetical protein ACFYXJ_03695 [Streptomyces sp. NPDC002667]|uniref:hypothetical protein n=1 Tax=Streptomyces sp. NPDC002667 TaxID=3364657 RepID=UPI0036B2E432